MKQSLRIIFMIFGIVMVLVPLIIVPTLGEEVIVGEQLCVDGNNNKNLVGIMCEDTEFRVFGIDGLTITIMVLGISITGISIVYFSSRSNREGMKE